MQVLSESLEQQRLRAAEASGGISGDVIYRCVEAAIRARKLSGRVLDYGAGAGNLTRRLLALGCFDQVTAVDILPRPADLPAGIDWVHLDLNARLPESATNFDVVIAAEVIEHLENPREVARELYRALKPSGTLILTTPNNESFRALIALLLRGHFVAFSDSCYPAHITALLRQDLRRILREVGFSDIQFKYTDTGGIPGYPDLAWQRLSFGLCKGLRFSDNLLVTAVK